MRVLYIGGTGEISLACVEHAVHADQQVTVFNRGRRAAALPGSVEQIRGDLADADACAALAARGFDVVCQFLAFDTDTVRRDIELFAGHCGQYVFISSASAYQKPCRDHVITEDTPLGNPFWAYSRAKADCETAVMQAHASGRLSATVVRPSHTYRTRLPGTVIDGDHMAWRLLNNQPIICHGDGQSLWTLTHADDFARAFVALCGNDAASGRTVHITDERAHTWDVILAEVGTALDIEPDIRHISSDPLVRYEPRWRGPLHGDKSNSVMFDNRRVRALAGGWQCRVSLAQGLQRAARFVRQRLAAGYQPDPVTQALVDRIIAEHEALGLQST